MRDELEVGVSMEQRRVRVDRNSRDQAVDQSPHGESRLPAPTLNGSGLFVVRRAAKRDHMAPEHKSSKHSQMAFIPSARPHLHPLPGVGAATSGSGLGSDGQRDGTPRINSGSRLWVCSSLRNQWSSGRIDHVGFVGLSVNLRRPASLSDKQRRRPPSNGTSGAGAGSRPHRRSRRARSTRQGLLRDSHRRPRRRW